jgi:hypothetical protein
MNLPRRLFLGSLLSAMATGALASTPSLIIAPTLDLNPIADTVRRYRELVTYYNICIDEIKHNHLRVQEYIHMRTTPCKAYELPVNEYRAISTEVTFHDMFVDLLSYMMTEFGNDLVTKEDIAKLFDRNAFSEKIRTTGINEELLLTLARGAIPIAIARDAFGNRKMHISPKLLGPVWKEFVRKSAPLLPN